MDDHRVFDEDLVDLVQVIDVIDRLPEPKRYLQDAENPVEFYSDREFIRRFRFRKDTVVNVIVPLLTGPNQNARGLPVPPLIKVITALRFYGTGSFQLVCGDLVRLSSATISRIVKVVSNELTGHLLEYVKFPTRDQEVERNYRLFWNMYHFPGVSGCIDCTHVAIKSPGGEFAELFRNRKQYMSLNVQVVSGPDMEILEIVTRWPGSTHDARIFSNSRIKTRLETRQVRGNLLGDSGYPQLDYLYTPVQDPHTPEERRYNTAQKQTRKVVECLFGVWKRRFACLGQKLRTNLPTSTKVITACAVLHNIAIRRRELPPEDPDRPMVQVPVQNVRPNERGRVVRAAFIRRHFSHEH